jgi:hypothetical protein
MSYCPLSMWKNILGNPNKGIHSIRIFNIAIIDYILTILLSLITTYLTKMPILLTTIIWCIVGIICHILFGVNTNITKYLGLHC